MEDHEWSVHHRVFSQGDECYSDITNIPANCFTCYAMLYTMVKITFRILENMSFHSLCRCRVDLTPLEVWVFSSHFQSFWGP